ncbi:MAG TPA: hypothetical protein VFA34_03060 [Actinomycetota bacterium]|jgi:hypothetical protein|nr:hypothetical protein [Actinomycetota bacterium]
MTPTDRKTPLTVLQVLLGVAIAESFVHYLDNTLRFSDYTGPNPPAVSSWIDRWMIPASWVLFTAAGIIGYLRFRQGRRPEAAPWLAFYSVSGLISILHYVGISISDLSVFQNTFVFLDIALGTAILGFAFWSALSARRMRIVGSVAPT